MEIQKNQFSPLISTPLKAAVEAKDDSSNKLQSTMSESPDEFSLSK